MHLPSALRSLIAVALMVPAVIATPVDVSNSVEQRGIAEKRSYVGSCDTCNMSNSAVLSCKCRNSSGQMVQTSLDLNRCIANAGGTAVWRVNGGFITFMGSCTTRRWNSPYLGVYCNSGGNQYLNSINIDEKVHNINGQLQCHV